MWARGKQQRPTQRRRLDQRGSSRPTGRFRAVQWQDKAGRRAPGLRGWLARFGAFCLGGMAGPVLAPAALIDHCRLCSGGSRGHARLQEAAGRPMQLSCRPVQAAVGCTNNPITCCWWHMGTRARLGYTVGIHTSAR